MFSKKIIHIFDDDKFIDSAINLLEEVNLSLSMYYVLKKKDVAFQYVKSEKVIRIDFNNIEERTQLIDFINSDLSHIVFFHALNYEKQELVLKINSQIKKVWLIWGYDLYGMWPLLTKGIYLPKTKSILNLKTDLKTRLRVNYFTFFLFNNRKFVKKFSNWIYTILNNTFNTKFYQAANCIDVVVPIVPTECAIVNKMGLKVQYAPFNYGCIEDTLGDKVNQQVNGKPNILVGNSADPSNNHLDVFVKLSKINLEGRKVYVPLSYGGNQAYIKFILEEGHRLFNHNFYPLIDFMALEEYNKILLSCGTLVFNHVRQQGVGNIVTMGSMGAKIYLNRKSPVYNYYKQKKMVIYDTNSLTSRHFEKFSSEKIITANKKIFYDLYSRNSVHKNINILVETINRNE